MDSKVDLDFKPILNHGYKFAVQVHTREEARNFLRCIFEQYPEKIGTWSLHNTHFGNYSTTCYAPWLNEPGRDMRYCDLGWYVERGYVIVQYEDLIERDINDSDQPISLLFGGIK